MENYWERDRPIYPAGAIELQDHENPLYFKNIFVRELARADGPAAAEAPRPVLRKGARVAVTGDSITEQRRYSRFIEDYLLACLPELDLRVIQLGWSGERAPGFAARMANDLLPWKPDVVTTCYGMNDGQYRPYEPQIGQAYAQAMKDIVARLRAAGAVVVVGSPGAVDTYSFKRGDLPPAVYNANLAQLREIARGIATENGMPFANVHDAMVDAMAKAKPALGDAYDVCGGDGFHPNENGHLVMAYAFLKALGLDGDLGTITLDMKGSASAQDGHAVLSSAPGRAEIESRRYPFCSHGDYKSPSATRSILPFLRFDIELNRLTLRVKNLDSPRATVTWGAASRPFPREGLERGINLAAEFPDNPFSDAFRKVDEAVARKQAYETAMVKEVVTHFRAASGLVGGDAEAQKALETLRARLIAKHEALHAEARAAVAAVRHTIVVKAD
jgi:lysophospholipase L1-like esterase